MHRAKTYCVSPPAPTSPPPPASPSPRLDPCLVTRDAAPSASFVVRVAVSNPPTDKDALKGSSPRRSASPHLVPRAAARHVRPPPRVASSTSPPHPSPSRAVPARLRSSAPRRLVCLAAARHVRPPASSPTTPLPPPRPSAPPPRRVARPASPPATRPASCPTTNGQQSSALFVRLICSRRRPPRASPPRLVATRPPRLPAPSGPIHVRSSNELDISIMLLQRRPCIFYLAALGPACGSRLTRGAARI